MTRDQCLVERAINWRTDRYQHRIGLSVTQYLAGLHALIYEGCLMGLRCRVQRVCV